MQNTSYKMPQKLPSNSVLKSEAKAKIAAILDAYSDELSDEDLKNILISITTIGWKQEDGQWKRL